jgi:enterobacterial common antigen flippase
VSPLGAVLRLGGSSAVAIVAAMALNKVQAVVLGPDGVARVSLLQTVITLTVIPASFGTAQALTRLGATDAARGGPAFCAARRAAAAVRLVSGSVCIGILALLASPICSDLLGGQVAPWELSLALGAIAAGLVASHDVSLLGAAHRVVALARFTLLDAIGGTVAAGAVLLALGRRGVAPALLVGAVVAALLSRGTVRRNLPSRTASMRPRLRCVPSLLSIGGPFTLAMILGAAVSTSIPILALHLLSPRAVAYYQVSATVATGYLSFLVAAMAQDYFPRLSAAPDGEVSRIIDQQQRLVVVLAMPLVLATVAAAPLILRLGFSSAFTGASTILRWQVLSDALRFSSWALAFAVLARLPIRWFVATEAIAGVTQLATTIAAVHIWGTPGLGIAWVATYAVYHAVVAAVVARRLGHRHSRLNRALVLAAVLSLTAAGAATVTGSSTLIAAVAAPAALMWSLIACRLLSPAVRARTSCRRDTTFTAVL